MLRGILKLSVFLNVLFLSVILLWQAATANASPILGNNDNLAKFIDDVSSLSGNNNHRGAGVVKRSLHITFDQPPLIDGSHSRSRTRHRRLRKKFHPNKLNNLPNIFQSTGTYNENLRTSHQIPDAVDDRLKRFRMLDPDEFQEMLNSFSQQNAPDEQLKGFNNLDSIGGMQLENYWSRK